MNRAFVWSVGLLAALAYVAPVFAADAGKSDTGPSFNRDIRPILVENCFACHGADSGSRQADLRLDKRDAAIAAKAILPGKASESALIERILSDDTETIMPPPNSHKKLTAAQKETLKKWIDSGAEYQPHWSYVAPVRPIVPAVKNQAWVRNPIDAFVLSKLEAKNLQPAAEADRRTLARRASLDVTGLPPEPAEVEAFVADPSPNAYETYLDKLFAKPQWGEHRARYWLDYARYGDTHGIHFDNYREMWSYRDWVIDAFNKNMAYDQFTLENLAGDLLPDATLQQRIGSGFNRCNITTNEGGIIDEEYLVLYTRDRLEATSAVWLGLTTQCAVCHDHKFDSISQREFYEMAAFFNNTTQGARDGNVRNTPPIITVPSMTDAPRLQELSDALTTQQTKIDARRAAVEKDFLAWAATAQPEVAEGLPPKDHLHFSAPLAEGKGDEFACVVGDKSKNIKFAKNYKWNPADPQVSLSVEAGEAATLPEVGDFKADQAFSFGAWVYLPKKNSNGAIFARMDELADHRGWDLWLQNDRVGSHIISNWPGNALKAVAKSPLKPKTWTHVFVSYDGSKKVAGLKIYYDGVLQPFDIEADTLSDTIATKTPFKIGQRSNQSRVVGVRLRDLRIYDRVIDATEVATLGKSTRIPELLAKPADKRNPKEVGELREWWLGNKDAEYATLVKAIEPLRAEEVAIKSRGTIAHVMQEKPAMPKAFILNRGEYDQRRDEVHPKTLAALPPMPEDFPKNRLGFAKWLLLPEHPLTARVTVNRMWQEIFGTGIVRTTGDLGLSGEMPSHPELLDWLALEIREQQWDVKKFYRLLLTSAAYRQAALTTAEKLERDPENRLLSRGPRFRMDAEMVRDYALAASGILVPKIGGPSVRPYQPEGVWEAVAMPGSDTRNYKQDTGENLYRRSMYTFVKRAAPPASLEIFNATAREVCAVRRERTNTPLQALVTLNDPQFVEAARHAAQTTLLLEGLDDTGRLDRLARKILGRAWKPAELEIIVGSLADLRAQYKDRADEAKQVVTFGDSKPDDRLDARELAAWTMLINEMLNLDEVLNK